VGPEATTNQKRKKGKRGGGFSAAGPSGRVFGRLLGKEEGKEKKKRVKKGKKEEGKKRRPAGVLPLSRCALRPRKRGREGMKTYIEKRGIIKKEGKGERKRKKEGRGADEAAMSPPRITPLPVARQRLVQRKSRKNLSREKGGD